MSSTANVLPPTAGEILNHMEMGISPAVGDEMCRSSSHRPQSVVPEDALINMLLLEY